MSRSTLTTVPEPSFVNPASLIDHTLLSPLADARRIAQLCDEAVEWDFIAVCVPPSFARQAVNALYGSSVRVASVVGFPLGYASSATKVQQVLELVALGCTEIDMVIPLGPALGEELDFVEEEIAQVVLAAGADVGVKVIIECCYLTNALKVALSERVVRAGAAFVKTSTGFGPGGAVATDVELLCRTVAGRVGVKAAGGIRSLADFTAMHAAGARRIGTSAGVRIMKEWVAGRG